MNTIAIDAPLFLASPVSVDPLSVFQGRRIALAWSARPGADKRELARRLLDRMTDWNFPEIIDRDAEVLQDSLGRPYLGGSEPGRPGISFSRGGGGLWAALVDQGRIGVDAAAAADFTAPYPYDRVFQRREMAAAQDICRGLQPAAAALLWSVKEAAVKALGCGFHGVDSLDLSVVFHTAAANSVTCVLKGLGHIQAQFTRTEWGWLSLAICPYPLPFPMPGGEP